MAQAGYTPIRLYYSTTASAVPDAANLAAGELALNIADMKLYCENSSGTVTLLASSSGASGDVVGPASSTANSVPTFSGTTGKLIQNNSGVTISSGIVTATGFSGPLNGTVGATTPSTGVFTDVTLNAQGDVRFADSDSSNWVAFQGAATITSNVTWTLPSVDGSSGQVLSTNGSGTLSWASTADIPIGTLAYFAGTTTTSYPGSAWLSCDGSVVTQSAYATLFARIGYIFNSASNTWSQVFGTNAGAYALGSFNESYYSAYLGGNFQIATGQKGSLSYNFTSTNGTSWEYKSNFGGSFYDDYAFGWAYNGTIYVIGDYYGFKTSTNLVNWTSVSYNQGPEPWYDGLWADSKFVWNYIYGGAVATSTNGSNWSQSTISTVTNKGIYSVTYGDKWVIAGETGTILTSTNAASNTWVSRTSGTATNIGVVRYLNNLYLYGNNSGNIATSTDAITWTARTSNSTTYIISLAYGNNLYLYSDYDGGIGRSTDGITWTRSSGVYRSGTSGKLSYGNNTFLLQVQDLGYVSTDGVTWSTGGVTFLTSTIRAQLYEPSTSVSLLAGDSGQMSRATDINSWSSVTSGTSSSIRALTYGNSLYVYGGVGGVLHTSTDAINWTSRTSGTTSTINGLAYNGNITEKYVYVGNGGAVSSSTNAINWTGRSAAAAVAYYSVTCGNGSFVAVGASGNIMTSPDAITWTSQTAKTTSEFVTVWWSEGQKRFLAGGANGLLASSFDGSNWSLVASGTTSNITGVTYGYNPQMDPGAGYWAFVGATGLVKTSLDGVNWTTRTTGTALSMQSVGFGSSSTGGAFLASGNIGSVFRLNPYSYSTATEFAVPTENANASSESTSKQNLFIKAS